jgi:hypothetical protein
MAVEPTLLIWPVIRALAVVAAGLVLWRLVDALCHRYAITAGTRSALLGAGGAALLGLLVATIVSDATALIARRQADRDAAALAQANLERFRKMGLLPREVDQREMNEEMRRRGILLSVGDQQKLKELCPADHAVEFRIAEKSFFLPWKWVRRQQASRVVWASTAGAACPPGPVPVGALYFRPPDAEIARARDLSLFSLRFGVQQWTKDHSLVIPTNPASRTADASGAYLEDISDAWRASNGNPAYVASDHRSYRLQQAAVDGLQPAPARITCTTLDPKIGRRMCSGIYFEDDGWTVQYEFYPKQDGLYQGKSNGLPDGPVEPDGLLAFDARIRAWLADLQIKPTP